MHEITTVIIRHRKERLSKCSLQPLVGRSELRFLQARPELRFDATGFLLLAVGAPVLSLEDATLTVAERTRLELCHPELGSLGQRPLLLLDATWRLLPKLESCLSGAPIFRSFPSHVRTAYPRCSKVWEDPQAGLASVEALYLALKELGQDDRSLLDDYRWKAAFLSQF